jgi:AcrR family transcriptional regulator
MANSRGGHDVERSRRFTAEERRNQLLDVAADLLVTEAPESVSMELVAERCGVSRPLVYKHFANRDELLGELYRREARRLDAELATEVGSATSIEDMFRVLIHGALRAADERGHLFTALRAAGGSSRQVRREQRVRDGRTFRAFVSRAVSELGLDPRLGPAAVSLLLAMVDPVLSQWRQDPTPQRAQLLEDAYLAIVRATLASLAAEASTEF